jgi:hypothetical protein
VFATGAKRAEWAKNGDIESKTAFLARFRPSVHVRKSRVRQAEITPQKMRALRG